MSALRGCALTLVIAAALVAAPSTPAPAEPAPAQASAKRVPLGFVGLVAEQTFATPGEARVTALRAQRSIGVTLLRQQFDWSTIERRKGRYDLSFHDAYVLDAARAGITIMPILFNPPEFHSSKPKRRVKRGIYPPKSNASFARFARVLVRRYGRRGSLWKGSNARLRRYAIRQWQIWNEPNISFYWPKGRNPSPRGYAKMARTVGRAIKKSDRGATVIGAGIPDTKNGVRFSKFVSAFLRAKGARSIDAFGVHPYGRTAKSTIRNIRKVRKFLNRRGGRRLKLWVTESGWATQGPRSPYTVGPAKQAAYARQFVRGLAPLRKRLKLKGFVLYSWQDAVPFPGGKDFWGLHTGLLDLEGRPKPALTAFMEAAKAIGSR